MVLEKGEKGQVYNIGRGNEKKNVEIAKEILRCLSLPETMIELVFLMSRRTCACGNGSTIPVIMKATDLVTVASTHGTGIGVRMVYHSALDKRPVPLGWSVIGASPSCDAAEDVFIHDVLPRQGEA